jgi:hypothetical protein
VPPDKHTGWLRRSTATFAGRLQSHSLVVFPRNQTCHTTQFRIRSHHRFGWASEASATAKHEFVNDNTLQEQGDYIVQAFDLMKAWGYVKMAFLFNLDYAQKSPNGVQDRTAPWSIFDQVGAARPAHEQLRLHMKSLYPDK